LNDISGIDPSAFSTCIVATAAPSPGSTSSTPIIFFSRQIGLNNGQTVPMKVSVDGPFTAATRVTAINLFSEANPVPEMAQFEFPAYVERIEVESRVRLAASQKIVAVATLADGALLASAAEVIVTIAGCMDGT